MYKLLCLKCGDVKIFFKEEDCFKKVNNLKTTPFCEKCNGKTIKKSLSVIDKIINWNQFRVN